MVTNKTIKVNYTELSQELAEVMGRMQQGDLAIDDAAASYERGLQIIALLEDHLQKAENRINKLKATSLAVNSTASIRVDGEEG